MATARNQSEERVKDYLFTFQHEVQNGVSNHPHHPSMESGVTIGAGLDLKHFSTPEHAYDEMIRIGFDEPTAHALSPAAGLHGHDAQAWADAHHDITISNDEQVNIFNHLIPHYEQSMEAGLEKLAHDHPDMVIPDHLSDLQRQALFDMNYNVTGGIATYPHFTEALFNGDYATAQTEAIRHADGKELYSRDQDFNKEFLTPHDLTSPDLHHDNQSFLDRSQTELAANYILIGHEPWNTIVPLDPPADTTATSHETHIQPVQDMQDNILHETGMPQDTDAGSGTHEQAPLFLEPFDGGFSGSEYNYETLNHEGSGTIINPADGPVHEQIDFVEGPGTGNLFEDAINRIHDEVNHPLFDEGGILGAHSTIDGSAPVSEEPGILSKIFSTFGADPATLNQNDPVPMAENNTGFFSSLFGSSDTNTDHVNDFQQEDVSGGGQGLNSIFTHWTDTSEPVSNTPVFDNTIVETSDHTPTFDWTSDHTEPAASIFTDSAPVSEVQTSGFDWSSDHPAESTASIFTDPATVIEDHTSAFDWGSDHPADATASVFNTDPAPVSEDHTSAFDWGSDHTTENTTPIFNTDPAPVATDHISAFDWGSDHATDTTASIFNTESAPVSVWSATMSDPGSVDSGHSYTDWSGGSDSFSGDSGSHTSDFS